MKFTCAASSNGARIIQTVRPSNGDYQSAKPLKFRIREGTDSFRVRFAAKASAAATQFQISLRLYGAIGNETGSVQIALVTVGTTWAIYESQFAPWTPSVPPNKYAAITLISTHTDGRTIEIDQLSVIKQTQSGDLAVRSRPGT
jgi:hypothetical protein